jgi:alkylmercury lyase
LEFDAAGSLTGFGGLSLQPTHHRLVLNGRHFYLWCALDGFLVAHALGRPVRIETQCPTTGAEIEVAASPERVEHVEPDDAVMSLVVPESGTACSVSDTRRGFCEYVNFYRSAQAALDSSERRRAAVLTMGAALVLARMLMLPLVSARL